MTRIGHEETRRLLLRDNDAARPAPEVTFADRYTLEVGGERVELAWYGPNHSPDNIYIHFPGHDTLMFIDVVSDACWGTHLQPQSQRGRARLHGRPGHRAVLPVDALHLRAPGPGATGDDVSVHQQYIADIEAGVRDVCRPLTRPRTSPSTEKTSGPQ